MKKNVLLLMGVLLLLGAKGFSQRKCGIADLKAAMIAKDPSWAAKFEAQRASLQGIADNYIAQKNNGERTTSTASPVPVVFHIMVDSAQFDQMGGTAGIVKRCDSQIAVLNRDYNRQNSDSTLIPSGWKPLYGNTGIHFGLAHTSPTGAGTPGYEIKIIPSTPGGFSDGGTTYGSAKTTSAGGLDSWDVSKYMNVWCFNFADGSGLLGITIAKSFTGSGGAPVAQEGICITYLALGKQTVPSSLSFPGGGNYTLGRTLTHEVGHFFEIWHTWGDDGGACPWDGGYDDGIADTPPESDANYGSPVYTISGGTIYDGCHLHGTANMQPIGIPCLDFMDYSDDNGMMLFTNDQAAAMASQVAPGGENYPLTQNPTLLNWPSTTGMASTAVENSLNVFPNPSTGIVNITFNQAEGALQQVTVTNTVGQQVFAAGAASAQDGHYTINLSAMAKGMYYVQCGFGAGSITRRVLLQ